MPPELSDKMPAQQDSQMASRFPSEMASDAPPYADEGGDDDAPIVPVMRDSAPSNSQWGNTNDQGEEWQTDDKKLSASDGWSVTDRIEGTEDGVPQRDADDVGTEGLGN